MKFLNPRTDFAFKRIFGCESDTSKLISLLNAVLQSSGNQRITEIDILNPYNPPKVVLLKESYLDLRVRDKSGKQYLIEMQVANVQGMHKRVLYNACKQYGNQLERGDDYLLLNEVIGITFTDFVLFDNNPRLRNSFMLRDQVGRVYSHDLELIFVELPKFKVAKEELDRLDSMFDKWLYFLKYVDDLSARPSAFDSDQEICSAFESANLANLDKDELALYENNLTLIRDQRGRIAYALNRGIEKGRRKGIIEGKITGKAEGLCEGKAEGLREGKEAGRRQRDHELVLQAHQNGWSAQQIGQFLGLERTLVQTIISEDESRKL